MDELLKVLKKTCGSVHTGCWCCLIEGKICVCIFWMVGLVLCSGQGCYSGVAQVPTKSPCRFMNRPARGFGDGKGQPLGYTRNVTVFFVRT